MKRHATILALALIVGIGTLGSFAQAQTRATPCNAATPNNAICISVVHAATNVDGTPTVLPLSTLVEQRIGTGTFTAVGTYTTTDIYLTNLAPGAYTFRGYTISGGGLQSAASNTVGRSVAAPPSPPNAPVFTIAVIITREHAPIFTIAKSGANFTAGTWVGDAPIGRSCGEYVYTHKKKRFHRIEVARKETWEYTGSLANLAAPCAPRA